jgi:hypothetical protein
MDKIKKDIKELKVQKRLMINNFNKEQKELKKKMTELKQKHKKMEQELKSKYKDLEKKLKNKHGNGYFDAILEFQNKEISITEVQTETHKTNEIEIQTESYETKLLNDYICKDILTGIINKIGKPQIGIQCNLIEEIYNEQLEHSLKVKLNNLDTRIYIMDFFAKKHKIKLNQLFYLKKTLMVKKPRNTMFCFDTDTDINEIQMRNRLIHNIEFIFLSETERLFTLNIDYNKTKDNIFHIHSNLFNINEQSSLKSNLKNYYKFILKKKKSTHNIYEIYLNDVLLYKINLKKYNINFIYSKNAMYKLSYK